MSTSPLQWDLDSDEIASVTSQDLHDNRPNRWAAEKASWRYLTLEERRLWQSMKMVEDGDVAVHLYNAHALKKRGRDAETAQDVTVTTDNGQQSVWAPPKAWTAWPLSETRGLDRPDRDDEGTFRLHEARFASSDLRDELSATILRLAKERFYKDTRRIRKLEATESREPTPSPSPSPPPSSPSSEEGKATDDGNGGEDVQAAPRKRKRDTTLHDPTPATDDEQSYQLLRLPVAHVLARLETTLRILHNARTATADYASDSSTSSDSEGGRATPARRRSRGRPRSTRSDASSDRSRSRLGRPRKTHVPRPGETHEEMLVRVARESHRRIPRTKELDDAFEAWLREGDERREPSVCVKEEEEEEEEDGMRAAAPWTSARDKRIRRLGLRNWSDVVGAAALAGFEEGVIARTARRCASLFGEGMTMRRLDEGRLTTRRPAFESVDYRPEPIRFSDSETEDGDDDKSRGDDDNDDQESRRGRSSLRSRSRSRSQSHRSRSLSRSSAGCHLCPIASCERAATGFSRKTNLRRHLRLVHPNDEEREDDDGTEHGDSGDEVFGAVHVDGFLKPIVPARGWWESRPK